MNDRRSEAINNVVSLLHDKHEAFLEGTLGCGFECSSIMYVWSSFQGHEVKLVTVSEAACGFTGRNYKQLVEKVLSFESPRWYHYSSNSKAHRCDESSFGDHFEELNETIEGLQLSDHVFHIP